MRDQRVRAIAEIGLAVALAIALNAIFSLVLPFRMPFGGSLSLIMLPIVFIALMRGTATGIVTGILVGFSDLMFDPFVISIPQMLLDYPIAYGLVGLAGLFALTPKLAPKLAPKVGNNQSANANLEYTQPSVQKMIAFAIAGTVVGGLARLAAHVASGVIFFAQYAPEAQNVWVYSLIYNATFMGPNIVMVAICTAVAFPLVRSVVYANQQA